MGASPLRLLPAVAAVTIAGALLPVGAATAAPAEVRATSGAAPAVVDAPLSEPATPRIDPASVVRTTREDGASTKDVTGGSAPPIGLLALLVPILLCGGIVTAVTLRRVR